MKPRSQTPQTTYPTQVSLLIRHPSNGLFEVALRPGVPGLSETEGNITVLDHMLDLPPHYNESTAISKVLLTNGEIMGTYW